MSDNAVKILGPDGNPVVRPRRQRISGLSGGSGSFGGPPYDAADIYGQHLGAWQPYLWSPDGELNMYRDRIVSRVRDLVRNDGWASGTVTRILDSAIGPLLHPVPKPDHRYLCRYTGNSKFDHVWAKEFSRALEASWREWAVTDTAHYCDAQRQLSFSSLMKLAFRHKIVDGDALCQLQWIPERIGRGRAKYATAIQLIDPDRLSNPQLRFDQMWTRGGVEIDEYGAAKGYWIRRAHQGDWFNAAKSQIWDLIPKETDWGRPIIVHDFDPDRASQHRGGVGIFTPVLQRLRMLIKYDGTELDSAIINAIFAAYIESPFDKDLVQSALDDDERVIPAFQADRAAFHDQHRMMLGNARIPILYPGEAIKAVAATRPVSNFKEFESSMLRNVAAGAGVCAEQISGDWAAMNYSSARSALLEAWKTLYRRRQEFNGRFSANIRIAHMEEAFETDPFISDTLPTGGEVPSFIECRGAYARCSWMGPGRGWIDPVAEKQGAILGMQAGLSTLEQECAEQGQDYEEVLEQRRYEVQLFEEYGLNPPEWSGHQTSMEDPASGGKGAQRPNKTAGGEKEEPGPKEKNITK